MGVFTIEYLINSICKIGKFFLTKVTAHSSILRHKITDATNQKSDLIWMRDSLQPSDVPRPTF